MKQLLLLLLVPFAVFSQQQDTIMYGDKVFFTGKVYLDSVAIDINKTFLDLDNIQSVETQGGKQSAVYSHAPKAVFITRKVPEQLKKLNTIYVRDSISIKFVVDGSYIEKPGEYLIETSCIKGISVLDTTKGVLHDPPSITLLITTRKEKKNKD